MKPLANQTSLVLWGGAGVGRAVSLALARSGSAVTLTDPDPGELARIRDLLLSKNTEAWAIPWKGAVSDGRETYAETAREIGEKVRPAHPVVHRVVLTVGMDERFWMGPVREEAPSADLILGRLEALLDWSARWLTTQARQGRIVVLWPGEAWEDESRLDWVRRGADCVRAHARGAAEDGIAVSLVRFGWVEKGPWAVSASGREVLRAGEVGEMTSALESLPRRVWMKEIEVSSFEPAKKS